MALDKTRIVDDLSSATVIEIADLVKELESKWGVTAAAPVAMAAAAPGGAAAPAADATTPSDVGRAPAPAGRTIAVTRAVRRVAAGLGRAVAAGAAPGAPAARPP